MCSGRLHSIDKEVIHEHSISIAGGTKAPDYCFRLSGVPKFFVEAKKPSINIKDDTHPAYQLRRYAWSAKLPLSILTDFEEFAVYDCRPRQQHACMFGTHRAPRTSRPPLVPAEFQTHPINPAQTY